MMVTVHVHLLTSHVLCKAKAASDTCLLPHAFSMYAVIWLVTKQVA